MNLNDISTYAVKNTQIYRPIIFPEIEINDDDLYIMSASGDRLDNMAYEFYSNTDNFWMIAVANMLDTSTLWVEPGLQLRIPMDVEKINNDFKQINEVDVYF